MCAYSILFHHVCIFIYRLYIYRLYIYICILYIILIWTLTFVYNPIYIYMYIHVIISNGFHIAIDVATTQGTEGASCAPCPRTSWRTAQRSPRKRLRMEGNELRTTRRLRKFWKNNIGITWYNNNCYNHRYNCYSRRTVVITTVLQQLQSNFHQTTSDSRAWWTKPTDQWGGRRSHDGECPRCT